MGPTPQRLDRDEEEAEVERERDQALGIQRRSRACDKGLASRPADGEPSGEDGNPQAPERRRLARHRDEAVARDGLPNHLRLEHQACDEGHHPGGERRDEIGQHDFPLSAGGQSSARNAPMLPRAKSAIAVSSKAKRTTAARTRCATVSTEACSARGPELP